MDRTATEKMIFDEIERCKEMVKTITLGGHPHPSVHFDLTGRTHGQAWGHAKIRINMPIAMHLGEKYIKTVTHEFAHILNSWLCEFNPKHPLLKGDRSGRGHGKGWKSCSVFLGIAPERCASREDSDSCHVAGATGASVSYDCKCGKGKYHVSQRKSNNIELRGMQYYCKVCHSSIKKSV